MRRQTCIRRLLAFVVGSFVVACTELQHTNPFDPAYPMTITIHAPDTVTSLWDTFQLSATTDPAWAEAPFTWKFDERNDGLRNSDYLQSLGNDTYRVRWMSGTDPSVTAIVEAGPHWASKRIVLSQRMGKVTLRPCEGTNCLAFLEDGVGIVSANVLDSNGYVAANASATPGDVQSFIVSRDPAVATVSSVARYPGIVNINFNALSRGTTRLVFTKYASDSLTVHVDHRPATVSVTCPASIRVGQSAQLSARVLGPTGLDLLVQPPMFWGRSGTWTYTAVSNGGVVTGLAEGTEHVYVVENWTYKGGFCDIRIDP